MKKIILGLTMIASSVFATEIDAYSQQIFEEDQQMVARVEMRNALYSDVSGCLLEALSWVEEEVDAVKAAQDENFDAYDEKILREDLRLVARVKARTCLAQQ